MARKTENSLKSLCKHAMIEWNKSPPNMQLLQGNINCLSRVEKVFRERDLPLHLGEACLDVFRNCEPFPTYQEEKGSDWDVHVSRRVIWERWSESLWLLKPVYQITKK
jgi:hypothetical protein